MVSKPTTHATRPRIPVVRQIAEPASVQIAMRWSTPIHRSVARSKWGNPPRNTPIAYRTSARLAVWRNRRWRVTPAARRRANASIRATPAIHRKDGKTTSVGVQPCQSACLSGQYAAPASPGVLTRIISAIVAPRKASSETRRSLSLEVVLVTGTLRNLSNPCILSPRITPENVVADPSLFDGIDLYETLQISPNADLDTIHRVYRLLAQRFHPDNRETGSATRFREIHDAYMVLSDPATRAQYDIEHHKREKDRWRLVSTGVQAEDTFESERLARLTVLEVLYTRRKLEPRDPGHLRSRFRERARPAA